ncbi:prolipoprotein diacylglyceryl transferase [Kordia sp.]|uniref:prolipoprotein diacylglyceryl transferase n=1 Tax=Kordia sp. TaxID=1965332 RepID=UPI003B5AB38B
MYPELFDIQLPSFLGGQEITIYSYATCIVLGTLIAAVYTRWSAKKDLGITNLSNTFFYFIFIAGFIGGKFFYYMQNPQLYIENPSLMLDNFSGGFVFYGSFVTIIPFIIWYLKKQKMNVLAMLDIFAITTIIVHALGRMGCFMAGCCFGKSTESFLGIIFPTTSVKVHPTQLYEVGMLVTIFMVLIALKKRKQFNGQLFLIYLILYGIGRSTLELFRGDERGFIIQNLISHSQFIALCLISIAAYFYFKLHKQLTINTFNN